MKLPLRFFLKDWIVAVFMLFIMLLFPFSVNAAENILEITDQADKVLFSTPVSPECGFLIEYTHSVALTPVKDYFVVKNGDIYLTKTEYHDFGAGLPFETRDDQTMKFDNKRIVLDEINHKVSPFTLRVGRIAHHKLMLFENRNGQCIQGKTIPLRKLTEAGRPLTFKMAEN